jgi:hypothetical protein
MESLFADGYVWNAYIIIMTYLITAAVSALVQFVLFQILCFANFTDLPLRLHRKALSRNQTLWPVVALLSLFDIFYLRFFPWINNEFCERSVGFPTLSLFVLVHVMNLLKNLIITIAMITKESLNLLQFLSLFSSLILVALSMYTLCIKVLYEKISLHEVVVVSKEFAERAEMAGVMLTNILISEDLESEANPIEALPDNIEDTATEQKEINDALEDLLQQRQSRDLSRDSLCRKSEVIKSDELSLEVENPYANKTIEILKRQMINDYGGRPLEYIPLAIIKAELDQLMQAARDGSPFDEERLDHLIRCMEYNDEYIAQKQEEERKWVEDSREFLVKSLEAMRPFIPVNIMSMTLQDLENAGLPKVLARRIMTKRCLWLIRLSQADIGKMHVADLTGKYSTEAQNLDVIEMAAIYHWLHGVHFESDMGDKKAKFRDGLKRTLKEKMGSSIAFDELMKKRNSAYKNATGPFVDIDAVYTQDVVSSEDAFSPRLSFRGLTRPAFQAAARAILETKFKSDQAPEASGEINNDDRSL